MAGDIVTQKQWLYASLDSIFSPENRHIKYVEKSDPVISMHKEGKHLAEESTNNPIS